MSAQTPTRRRKPPNPASRAQRSAALCGWAIFAWVCAASGVRANDFDDFQAARTAYEAADYPLARERFEALVGGDVSRLENRSLTLESHKYLAATYLFLRETPRAEKQFERLLTLDQKYVLDPIAFPHDVQVAFERVRTRLAEARAEKAKAEAASAQGAREAKLAQRAEQQRRIDQLRRLASTERVEQRRSRLVATVPFGVGQFQNDDDGLGIFFAVAGGTLLVANVSMYFVRESLIQSDENVESTANVLHYGTNISAGLLAAVAVIGIIDAQLRFKPTRSFDRRRKLPGPLQEGFDFGLSPAGVELRF